MTDDIRRSNEGEEGKGAREGEKTNKRRHRRKIESKEGRKKKRAEGKNT